MYIEAMLHPDFAAMVVEEEQHPEPNPRTYDAAQRRRDYRVAALDVWREPAEMEQVVDGAVPLPGREIRYRLYVPPNDAGDTLVVYFHGGSFVVGDLDTHDGLCRRLAVDTTARFLAVDYRLAPEHHFPAPLDDAIEMLRYVSQNKQEFASESVRLVVMGDSAGANLATVAAAQVRHEIKLAAQVLIYPTLGAEIVTASAKKFGHGFLLDIENLRFDYGQYVGSGVSHTDERVSPLFARNLQDVAPAIIVVAEFDPLRDEAIAYAGLLEHYGVRVVTLEALGMPHGFLRLGGRVPDALAIVDEIASHVRDFVSAKG